MLAQLDPREYAEILASREVIPLDDGWRQADTIAGAFHDECEFDRAAAAGKSRIDKSRLHKPGNYIPRIRPKKRSSRPIVNQTSIDVTQSIIESQFLR